MKFLRNQIDFYGRPRPVTALHCYLIQAGAFALAAYLFVSWDFSSLAHIPADAYDRAARPLLFSYWKTPWLYYTSLQFIYDFFPRPGVTTLLVIQYATICALFCGLFGIVPRLSAWIAFALGSHLIGMFILASDTMDASTTVLLFMLFLVGLFPGTAYYRIGRKLQPFEMKEIFHGPVFLLLFYMDAYYFVSGINKIIDIKWDWFIKARLDLFSIAAIEKSLFTSTWSTSLPFSELMSYHPFALISAVLVFFLEILAPIALFVPRLSPAFLMFFASMHLSIYLSHGYGYWTNTGADFILLPYTGIFLWLRGRGKRVAQHNLASAVE